MATAQQPAEQLLKLSLEDCLKQVYANNYNRQSVALNEETSKESYKQAKKERLPDLSASLGESYSYGNSTGDGGDWNGNYSLNTGITLYQGGSISGTIEKNKLSAEQASWRTAQYDNELTIQVLQAFLTALGNEELLRYQQAVLTASEEQLRQGEARLRAGEILESDYLLLEAQYATDLNQIKETHIARDNSLNALKALMAMDLSQTIEIIYPDEAVLEAMGLLPSEEEVIIRSLETSPDLRISEYNIDIAEAGVRISRSGYMPTVGLNASLGTGHSGGFSNYGSQLSDRLGGQVGVSISIPLFDRGRTKSNVAQSRFALRQAELERKQTELDIRQTLIQEYRDVVLAESQYRSSDIRRKAYDASFEAYRLKFEQGSITTVELLQQQNNYISAMNEYIQSKYGFILKRKILDVYMGEAIVM